MTITINVSDIDNCRLLGECLLCCVNVGICNTSKPFYGTTYATMENY